MKNKLPPPPVTDPSDLVMPPTKSLKAYFCGCALSGFLANSRVIQGMFRLSDDNDCDRIVAYAYDLGQRLYEL